MELELAGKVALITGGSYGIGRYIAQTLAAEGCDIAICARGQERLEEAVADLRGSGARAEGFALDLTDKRAAAELADGVASRLGPIDILINNVGGNRRGRFADTSDEDWATVVEMNLLTHTRVSRAVVAQMKERGGGVILFIASVFGREAGGVGLSIYNATKSAVISLAKIMALELGPHGIRVNSVAPGSIRYPGGSWDRRCIEDPDGMAAFVEQTFPIGRFGTAEEVADVVVFLASARASLITGTCVSVDGGQSRSLI